MQLNKTELSLRHSLRVVALHGIDEQLSPPVNALARHLATDSICKFTEVATNEIDLILIDLPASVESKTKTINAKENALRSRTAPMATMMVKAEFAARRREMS